MIMKLEQMLEGAIGHRGKFTGYFPPNEKGEIKKDARTEHIHINWERHYSGKDYFGLSPVKIVQNGTGRIGVCRWIGWDLDVEMEPQEFRSIIFKLNTVFICYKTSGNRWHVHHYLDEWTDVEECRKLALHWEEKFKKIFKKGVDTGHTVPSGYTIAEGKPGGWLFMPYCPKDELINRDTICYSPRGNPLTKEQTEYSIKWRKHPLLVSLVGAEDGEGGREKFLFIAKQVIEHNKLDLTPYEVNAQFNKPLSEPQLTEYIKKHEIKDYINEFNKEYLEEHYNTYLKQINGFRLKDLKGVGVLDGFIDEEQEEKAKKFLDDVIYIKLDDLWYDKSTGGEYKAKAIQITYGHIWEGKISEVIKNFSAFENAQMVEKGVYRPDLFKNIDDPIVKDEKNLLQLNQYRPSDIEPLAPDTPERKAELELFKTLIRNLTEKEGIGLKGKKEEEIQLYDYVLDHLSMPFKQPGNKVRSALLFHSEEPQLGKNTFFQIVQEGLGEDNCAVITPEEAVSRERTFLENQLVLIDEILIDGDYKKKISTLNILKPLMTNELHSSRPLFKNWRQVFSTCGFMAFTNHKDAIAVKINEARYTMIDINKTRDEMGGDEFFNKIWTPEGKIRGTIVNVVKHFLLKRNISDNFDPKAPSLKTNFLKVMAEHGGHPLLPSVKPLFNEGATPFNQSLFSIQEAFDWLKKNKNIPGRINDFAEVITELGCERVGECFHKKSNRSPTLYIKKNHEFFCDKSMSSMVNEFWFPIGRFSNGVYDYSEWGMTSNDTSAVIQKIKEIDAYEEFHRKTPKEDPEEAFETIRRNRKKG